MAISANTLLKDLPEVLNAKYMKQLLFIISVIVFDSCSAQHGVIGNYYKAGKDFSYELELHKDSTFLLRKKYFEVDARCQGQWYYVSKNTILLKCEGNRDLIASISAGNMSDTELKIIVKNGKLKLNRVTLIREK